MNLAEHMKEHEALGLTADILRVKQSILEFGGRRTSSGGGGTATLTPVAQLKKEIASSTVTYTGTNASNDAATSSSDWRLSKVTYSAGSFVRERATDSWDNRLTASYS